MSIDITQQMADERFLRLPEVISRTGLSRASIYKRIQLDTFPSQIQLGGRCSGWRESEVSQWMAARVSESRPITPT